MKRIQRHQRQETELDITAFMNLMIVLVPILLINMMIAQASVLELNFPALDSHSPEQEKNLQWQVLILEDQLLVADNQGGVIKRLPKSTGGYDFDALGRVMQELKARLPEKREVTVMAQKQTSYQTLVSVMDKVRSFTTVVAGSVVQAELFPEIAIADAPEQVDGAQGLARAAEPSAQHKVKS